MKTRIRVVEVVLDELAEVTLVELVGQLLPRRKIEARLIEAAAEALAVLGDEAGHQAAGHHGADEKNAIEQTPHQ